MMRRLLGVGVFACVCLTTGGAQAVEAIESMVGNVADYWTIPHAADSSPYGVGSNDLLPGLVRLPDDREVAPVQMLSPQSRPPVRTARRNRRTTAASADTGLASVPYMIGDTGAGTCLSIGGLNAFSIEHPTLTCSRLNISENNSPVPTDRSYVSYRHFHNVSDVRVLTIFERAYSVDRLLLGMERTLLDGKASFELRLPVERRITSNLSSEVNTVSASPSIVEPFQGGRQNELGNVSMMFKTLVAEGCDFAISAGVGTTVPTARDFTYHYSLNNLPDAGGGIFLNEVEDFELLIENETVYISPFLAWLWQPDSRFFHQGFWQIEAAANPTDAFVRGSGRVDVVDTNVAPPTVTNAVTAFTPSSGLSTKIHAQTLMRLNLGWGYILSEDPRARWIKRMTGMFEVHYTTTLQDAKLSSIPLTVTGGGAVNNFFMFGNFINRTDILNMAVGLSANTGSDGRTIVTNGIVLPVSSGEERSFDLEYNLQVQRVF